MLALRVRSAYELLQRAGNSISHELIAAGIGVDFVALQLRAREDAAQDVRDEQTALILRHALVYRLVIGIEAREAEAEEDDRGAGGLDLVDDRTQIRLGRRDRNALQVVVTAEADDHDAGL